MRPVSVAAIALLVTLTSAAHAHHPSAGVPENAIALAARAGELEAAPGGFWRVGELMMQVAPWERASLYAELAVAHVSLRGGGEYTGPADANLGARVTAYRSPAGLVTIVGGLGVELPTGDAEAVLGGGHYTLSPSAHGLIHASEATTVAVSLAGHFAVAARDDVVAPAALPEASPASAAPQRLLHGSLEDEPLEAALHGGAWEVHSDVEVAFSARVSHHLGPIELALEPSLLLIGTSPHVLGPLALEGCVAVDTSATTSVGVSATAQLAGQERQRYLLELSVERRF